MKDWKPAINWELKKMIKERGLTLRGLQAVTGINQALLSMITTGKYNADDVERHKIARALKVKEYEIFPS